MHLRHLLTIGSLSQQQLHQILNLADSYLLDGTIQPSTQLQGIQVANLFFEPSTRTRVTFEIAEKSLAASVTSLNIEDSSTKKGESAMDTLKNLAMMGVKIFVIRHPCNGAANFFAGHVDCDQAVINAGDGSHAHPTQALLDMATLRHHRRDFKQLKVVIVGDVLHSRVARSQIKALKILGVSEIRVVAPRTLYSSYMNAWGVRYYERLSEGLKDVDVIFCLRLQTERMAKALIPSQKEFFHLYGIGQRELRLASPEVLVMHPGPVNRGVEVTSEVMEGDYSVIFNQVTHGVAVRMAVLSLIEQGLRAEARV